MKIVAGVNSSELSQEGREPYRNSVRINSGRLLCTGADVSNLGTQVPADEEAKAERPDQRLLLTILFHPVNSGLLTIATTITHAPPDSRTKPIKRLAAITVGRRNTRAQNDSDVSQKNPSNTFLLLLFLNHLSTRRKIPRLLPVYGSQI